MIDNQISCVECLENYMFVKDECVFILAKNCLTYISFKECEKCNLGYELAKEDDKINCQKV